MPVRRLLLAPLALLALVACDAVPYSEGTGRKVFVTGDSLVVDSAGVLSAALILDGHRAAIDAVNGTDIGWAADQLEAQLVDAPDVAVVAAGTNTWVGGWDRRDRAAVRRVQALAGEVACTVWVTPATTVWAEGTPRRAPFYDTVVDAIEAAAADTPDLHVARWARHASWHGAWYQEDGVHHSDLGRAAYARFIRDSVAELCP